MLSRSATNVLRIAGRVLILELVNASVRRSIVLNAACVDSGLEERNDCNESRNRDHVAGCTKLSGLDEMRDSTREPR